MMGNDEGYWECLTCKYQITIIEMKSFRLDFGCPRCGNSFDYFTLKLTEDNNDGTLRRL